MDAFANTSHTSNKLLAAVDRLSRRIGMLNTLVDMGVERIAPIRSVAAACSGSVCYTQCEWTEDCCCRPNSRWQRITYRSVPIFGCDGADWCPGPCASSCPQCSGC
jgi:hypothetical protein